MSLLSPSFWPHPRRPLAGIPGMNTVVRISRWLSTKTGNYRHAFNPRWIWALLINLKGVVNWKDIAAKPEGLYCREFEIGEFRSLLQTQDGKIHLAPSDFVEMLRTALEKTVVEDARYPFLLVNQRRTTMMNSYLDHFVPQQYVQGDFVEMNPHDAERIGIRDWQEVTISSSVSSLNVLARLTNEVPRGVVSMDHGWGSRLYDPKGGEAPVVLGQCKNRLVPAAELDSIAGTPKFNSTAVGIRACFR
jgi:formate dehydrogenase